MEIRCISSIHQYLTVQGTQTLIWALVFSRLDYCSSLLSGYPLYLLSWLQTVENCNNIHFQGTQRWPYAASSESSSLVTSPRQNRLQTVNCLSQLLLWHISSLCLRPSHCVTPSRQLHSSADTQILRISQNRNLWPTLFFLLLSLPSDIRHIQSSHAIKTVLKAQLYKQYHNKWFYIVSSYLPYTLTLPRSLLCSICALTCGWVWCARNTILWLHNLLFLRF